MDKLKLEKAGIDYEKIISRFAGRDDLYEKYLNKFKDDSHLAEAEHYYNEKDYNNVLEQVHAFKGITGTLGMDNLYAACQSVVDIIRSEKYEELDKNMKKVREEYNKVMVYFE